MSISLSLTEPHAEPAAENFAVSLEGKSIQLHVLDNAKNLKVSLTNYGARIVSILMPDACGKFEDVVLGFGSIQEYFESNEAYFGATIGRVANRIGNGHFPLNGAPVKLTCNQPPNHLHGGFHGFHNAVWDIVEATNISVTYRHLARESFDGYPGDLLVEVRYSLNQDGDLRIDYSAWTDKSTIVNLTNHAYFNLSGAGRGSVAKHQITLFADSFTPVNESLIPTGEIRSVSGTPFDLRQPTPIGRHWNDAEPQMQIAGGYDHNFVLRKNHTSEPELAAKVIDPTTGRSLEVLTTEPAVQFYTANALSGLDVGRQGVSYLPRTAFCLETQHYPDSPNRPEFPSIRLEPGETFRSTTIYRFQS